MSTMKSPKVVRRPPEVTGRDARAQLLARNIRVTVPLRNAFVQRPQGQDPRSGPLATFVQNGDLRGLRAYMMVVAASGGQRPEDDGRTTELDSLVWARLFDAEQKMSPASARAAAWRTLERLERRRLIRKTRSEPGSRTIRVTLLREDGSGEPYTRPDGEQVADRFLRLPTTFWTRGFDEQVTLPGLAMLLVIAKERPWTAYPPGRMEQWYGFSGDTTQRGLKNLRELGLVERREGYTKAPLSPTGVTLLYQYRLVRTMRPPAGARPGGVSAR